MLLQNRGLLTAAERKLAELGKQYDVMLESKQIELSRHLKELCQRNDQVVASSFSIYFNQIILEKVFFKLKIVLLGH